MEVAPHQNILPFLTETELEVAVFLTELPELLRDPVDRLYVSPNLRWGARRRRRSPRLRSSSSPSAATATATAKAAIPEDDPSPSTSLPHRPHLDDKTKGDAAAAVAAAAAIAGSPSSPHSFPASGGEEPKSHPQRPPPPPPALLAPSIASGMKYSSKNSKHHNVMLKEYSHMVTSLSAERSILHQEIEQYKTNCTLLKAVNSRLIECRSKLSENQIALPKPSAVGAPPADSAAEEHRLLRSPAKRRVEFDLNKLSEEAEAAAAATEREAAAAAAAQSAHKAAKSAEARKRRMDIMRAKSSMPIHKKPRLQ